MIGTRIGDWLITEEIGDGGHAFVFKGVRDGEVAAVKMLKPSVASEENLEKRFKIEVEALKSLQHSSIVGFRDYIYQGDYHYLVLEYMDAGAIDHLLRTCGPTEPRYTLPIFYMILDGMSYAHSFGYIHRDIKPNNILLNKGGEAKISDFGIAKVVGGESLTKQGYVLGTSLYMAPEYLSQGVVTPQTDIYALGVLLYEMLTTHKPFEFKSDNEPLVAFAKRVCMGTPTPLSSYRPVPPDLERIVMKAIARDPKKRYRSVEKFQGDLKKGFPDLVERPIEIPEGRPMTSSVPISAMARMERPGSSQQPATAARNPWIAITIAVAVGLMVGAISALALSLEWGVAVALALVSAAAVFVRALVVERRSRSRRPVSMATPIRDEPSSIPPARSDDAPSEEGVDSDRMPYHGGVQPQGVFEETHVSELNAFLEITTGKAQGKRYGLRPISRIGRDLRFDIRPPDPEISRHHAMVAFTGSGFAVKDTKSTNGTFMNEIRLEPNVETDLKNGDIVRVGRTSMRFEYETK